MEKKFRKKYTYIISCILICCIGVSIIIFFSGSPININKESISKEELKLFVDNQKAYIESTYRSKIQSNLDYNKFWSYEIEGTTPKKELIKRASELAIRAKVIQLWAQEEGIIEDISYDKFYKEWESKRSNLNSNSIWEYYTYKQDEMKRKIKEILKKEVTEEDKLQDYYNENLDNYKKTDTIKGILTIWEDGRAISSSEVEISHDTTRLMSEANEELANHLLELSEGETAIWGDNEEQKYQLLCTLRKDGGYMKFDEVVQAVKAQYVDELFEKQIIERTSKLKIKYNNILLNQINILDKN